MFHEYIWYVSGSGTVKRYYEGFSTQPNKHKVEKDKGQGDPHL